VNEHDDGARIVARLEEPDPRRPVAELANGEGRARARVGAGAAPRENKRKNEERATHTD
jgi:hypothetical protein